MGVVAPGVSGRVLVGVAAPLILLDAAADGEMRPRPATREGKAEAEVDLATIVGLGKCFTDECGS